MTVLDLLVLTIFVVIPASFFFISTVFEVKEIEVDEHEEPNDDNHLVDQMNNKTTEDFPEFEDEDYAYFDLERMKEAMSQTGTQMPHIETYEDLEDWLDRDEENNNDSK